MTHYKEQILACDFFTIDTVWLQTIYVLFFIELGSRRIHFAGATSNPNQTWITQQARQLVWELHDKGRCLQFLIHDNDCSFSKVFDAVFESEGIYIIHTPFQAPNANAHAERWVRTVREECLDHILIIHAEHVQRVLIEFAQYTTLLALIKVSISRCPFLAIYLRTLALFNVERYSAELSMITFVHRTATSFPPFDFISVQYPLCWSFLCTEKRLFSETIYFCSE